MDPETSMKKSAKVDHCRLKNVEEFPSQQTGTHQSITSRENHVNKNTADDKNSSVLTEKKISSSGYDSPGSQYDTQNFESFMSINSSQETVSSETDSGYQSQSEHSFNVKPIGGIGHQVGAGQLDIITKLAQVEPNLVRKIIQYVGYNNPDHLIR